MGFAGLIVSFDICRVILVVFEIIHDMLTCFGSFVRFIIRFDKGIYVMSLFIDVERVFNRWLDSMLRSYLRVYFVHLDSIAQSAQIVLNSILLSIDFIILKSGRS